MVSILHISSDRGTYAKKSKYNQKLLINSKVLFLIFSTLIVYSVNAEVKTNTEQFSTNNVEISSTREEETHNKKQAIGEAPTDDLRQDVSRLFLRDSEVLLNPREIQISIVQYRRKST